VDHIECFHTYFAGARRLRLAIELGVRRGHPEKVGTYPDVVPGYPPVLQVELDYPVPVHEAVRLAANEGGIASGIRRRVSFDATIKPVLRHGV